MNQAYVNVDGVTVSIEYDYYSNAMTDPILPVANIINKHTEVYFREHFNKLQLDNQRYVLLNPCEYVKYVVDAVLSVFPDVVLSNLVAYIPFQVLHATYETIVKSKYLRASVTVPISIHAKYQGDSESLIDHMREIASSLDLQPDEEGRLYYDNKTYVHDQFAILNVSMTTDDSTLDALAAHYRNDRLIREWMIVPFLVFLMGPAPIVKTSLMHYYDFDETNMANLLLAWIYFGFIVLEIGIHLGFILWFECSSYLTCLWFVLLGFMGGIVGLAMNAFC